MSVASTERRSCTRLELARTVGVEAGEVGGEFGCGIGEEEAGVRQRLADRRERCIVRDDAVEVPASRFDEGDGVGNVVDDLVG